MSEVSNQIVNYPTIPAGGDAGQNLMKKSSVDFDADFDLPVLFDETGTERVVGWYKYADGTKKPVYEKSFYSANVGANAREAKIGEILNADRVLYEIGSFVLSSGNKFNIPYIAIGNPNEGVACVLLSNGNVIINNFINLQLLDVIAIIRYTKTTDQPI